MERTIKIGKKSVKLNNNIGWTFIYKDQFGQDIIPTLMPILMSIVDLMTGFFEASGKTDEFGVKDIFKTLESGDSVTDALIHLSGLEFVDLLNITWSLAKCANDDIDPPQEWIREFDSFPVDEVAPKVFDMVLTGVVSQKKLERLKGLLRDLQPKTNQSDLRRSSLPDSSEDSE